MKNRLCSWCFELFETKANNQIYCEATHKDQCISCDEEFQWNGKPRHLYGAYPNHCKNCIKLKSKVSRIKELKSKTSVEKLLIQEKRKATMVELYGGESTLESKVLRDKKENTMLKLYGAKQTMNASSLALKNGAARRANKQKLDLSKSLKISHLFNSEEKLNIFLKDLCQDLNRKVTFKDIANTLSIAESEVSHKLAKYPLIQEMFIIKRDSWLELIVIDELINRGFRSKIDFQRRRKLSNRLEIDIFFKDLVGLEVNDLATHSKNGNDELSELRYSKENFKHGPAYHSHKHKSALNENINLYFLWEDDIVSGAFKDHLSRIIEAHELTPSMN